MSEGSNEERKEERLPDFVAHQLDPTRTRKLDTGEALSKLFVLLFNETLIAT